MHCPVFKPYQNLTSCRGSILLDIYSSVDIVISEDSSARLLATNSNYRYVKCIDVYPKSESDLLLAVGQANGKVSLTTFGPSIYDTIGLAGIELSKCR